MTTERTEEGTLFSAPVKVPEGSYLDWPATFWRWRGRGGYSFGGYRPWRSVKPVDHIGPTG